MDHDYNLNAFREACDKDILEDIEAGTTLRSKIKSKEDEDARDYRK